jgi:hypothetical protein
MLKSKCLVYGAADVPTRHVSWPDLGLEIEVAALSLVPAVLKVHNGKEAGF